jgi:phage-related protein
MPEIRVVFYREDDGSVPTVEYLNTLPSKAQDKLIKKIESLMKLGQQLRRPEADYLRDDIYELRTQLRNVQYRLLYFFYGTESEKNLMAVISHGTTKRKSVPPKEIDRAIWRRRNFFSSPQRHTQEMNR